MIDLTKSANRTRGMKNKSLPNNVSLGLNPQLPILTFKPLAKS